MMSNKCNYSHCKCNPIYNEIDDNNCNCNNQDCSYTNNVNIYTKWQVIPYAGTDYLPIPETPDAWSWPMCFLKRRWNNSFVNPIGDVANITIKNPHESLNLESEFAYLCHVQRTLSKQDVELAKYWGDGPPPKQFMPIADILIDTYGVPACHASRILYVLNAALNDTFVITWYFKYLWNIVRPCQYNRDFRTVLCTPNHPTYPAGHSTTAGCMAEILSFYFPKEREKLFALAHSCSHSRVLAGVHFRLDCDEGLELGVSLAECILKYTSQQKDMNGKNVDIVYNSYKNAQIFPTTLKQYIPFDRKGHCDSLLLNTNNLCR